MEIKIKIGYGKVTLIEPSSIPDVSHIELSPNVLCKKLKKHGINIFLKDEQFSKNKELELKAHKNIALILRLKKYI